MRKILASLAVLTLVVGLASCSSSDDEGAGDETTTTTEAATTTEAEEPADAGDPQAFVDAYTTGLSSGSVDAGALVLTEEQAACVGEAWVDQIGVDRFEEAGVTPEDVADPLFDSTRLGLPEEEGAEIVAAFEGCDVDIAAELAESITLGMGEEQISCTAENIDPELVDALLVKSFTTGENDAEFEALLASLDACDLPLPGIPTE